MAKQTHEQRLSEVETTLFGATRNGGGFIAETRETMEIVGKGIDAIGCEVRDLQASVKELARRGKGLIRVLEVSIPPIIVGAGTVLAVVLTK